MRICVFCSSSQELDERYYKDAKELGVLMAKMGHSLIYGGSNIGLMDALARSYKEKNGRITGVIPKMILDKGLAFNGLDTLIVTSDLRERKAKMEKISDAFIALPGGFGTLDEFLEIMTLKQLQLHLKPLVLINTLGYFDGLFAFFERLYRERFASGRLRDLYYVGANPENALKYIAHYQSQTMPDK